MRNDISGTMTGKIVRIRAHKRVGRTLAILWGLFFLSSGRVSLGGFQVPNSVYGVKDLEQAKADAQESGKAITFLYSDTDTTCGLCSSASMDVIRSLKAKSVVIYVNANNEGKYAPKLVQDAVRKPEAGQYIPMTIVTDADITTVVAIVPYASERQLKHLLTEARKAIAQERKEAAENGAGAGGSAIISENGKRTWTSHSGAELQAEFVDIEIDTVILRREDAQLVRIGINKLCEEDQILARRLSVQAAAAGR